jgi:hypothetical protein
MSGDIKLTVEAGVDVRGKGKLSAFLEREASYLRQGRRQRSVKPRETRTLRWALEGGRRRREVYWDNCR